jgi:hypothetical protein
MAFFAPFLATALCQAFFLALSILTSLASPWGRIVGLVVGSVYLEKLLYLVLNDRTLFGLATVTIAVTAATVIVVRILGGGFAQQAHGDLTVCPESHRLRFSIRGLMLLIAAVALYIASARALHEIPYPEGLVLFHFFVSLCLVTVGLVAVWAVLDEARPLARVLAVFLLSSILGFLAALAGHADPNQLVNIILVMSLYSAELLALLLVVRSCGYRFVWQTSQRPVHRRAARPYRAAQIERGHANRHRERFASNLCRLLGGRVRCSYVRIVAKNST